MTIFLFALSVFQLSLLLELLWCARIGRSFPTFTPQDEY